MLILGMMKRFSAAGESAQKDLGVWGARLAFCPFPSCKKKQAGEKWGCDGNTKWGGKWKTALDEVVLVLPRSPCGASHRCLGDGGG